MCLTEESKKRYRDFLEELAEKKSDEIFSNGGKDHAIVLYKILLDNSRQHVRIFCEAGVSNVWQDQQLQNSLQDYVAKDNTKLQILVEEVNEDAFASIKGLENVEISHVSDEGKRKIHEHFENNNCNFAVFDDDKYRYEYDKKAFKAYGSFNRPEIAKSMIKLFDDVYPNNSAD